MRDLFNYWEELPAAISDLFTDEPADYEDCKRLQSLCEQHGYTFSYGLDAVPYDLRRMTGSEQRYLQVRTKLTNIRKYNNKEAIKQALAELRGAAAELR